MVSINCFVCVCNNYLSSLENVCSLQTFPFLQSLSGSQDVIVHQWLRKYASGTMSQLFIVESLENTVLNYDTIIIIQKNLLF